MNSSVKTDNFTRFEPVQTDLPHANQGISSILTKVWSSILRGRESRQAIAVLQSFDDRMLKDIGVSRHEIEKIGRYGRPKN